MNTYTIQIPRKPLQAVSLFTSSDEARYILQCVNFEVKRMSPKTATVTVAATDGRKLAAYAIEDVYIEPNVPDSDSFMVDLRAPLMHAGDGNGITLAIEIPAEDQNVRTISFAGFEDGSTVSKKTIGGQFPNWRSCIPPGPADSPVRWAFDHRLLEPFAKAAELLNGKSYLMITSDSTEKPMVIRIAHHSGFVGVLMPVRAEGDSFGIPAALRTDA